MPWGMIAAAAATAAASYLGAKSQQDQMEKARKRALAMLNERNVGAAVDAARRRRLPIQQAIGEDVMMQNQAVGQQIAGNLNMQGLGDTGLGAALGAGATMGANFQNRQLLAEMDLEAIQEGIALQTQRAGIAMGFDQAMGTMPSPAMSAIQGASSGLGAWQNYQYGQQMNKYRSDYMDLLKNQTYTAYTQPAGPPTSPFKGTGQE